MQPRQLGLAGAVASSLNVDVYALSQYLSPRAARAKLLLAVAIALCGVARALAQLPLEPSLNSLADQPKLATITFSPTQVVTARRDKITFQKVGLQPKQVVDVSLRYPESVKGRRVAVEPLDGGRVLTPQQNLTVAPDGTFTFRFKAGSAPGLYQVRLHYDTEAIAVQFWVFDNDHLENSPIVLTPN